MMAKIILKLARINMTRAQSKNKTFFTLELFQHSYLHFQDLLGLADRLYLQGNGIFCNQVHSFVDLPYLINSHN